MNCTIEAATSYDFQSPPLVTQDTWSLLSILSLVETRRLMRSQELDTCTASGTETVDVGSRGRLGFLEIDQHQSVQYQHRIHKFGNSPRKCLMAVCSSPI